MTLARGAALLALLAAVVVVAVVLFSGSGSEEYKLRFDNAGQLVSGNQVEVGGRSVGSVTSIELTDDNQAEVTVKVSDDFAPLHEGTTAVIRAAGLAGVANRYIALTPGPNSNPELPAGATLASEKTTAPVDLDQFFDTLDKKTQKSLQQVIQGFATQYSGKEQEANDAIKYFAPALSTTNKLVEELIRDQAAFERFVVDTSTVVGGIAERRDDLASLVGNANATAGAIASENTALSNALAVLPTTLRRGNTTFVNLRATLDDLDVLVAASKPATKQLAPFLRELRPLVKDASPAIDELSRIVRTPGPNNDLTEAFRGFASLGGQSGATFDETIKALRRGEPVIEFLRPYAPDLANWFRDFGQSSAYYDANGHYARISPVFAPYSFSQTGGPGGTLTPQPGSQRLSGYQGGNVNRCPGAATQPPADGSAPFTDNGKLGPEDCDPAKVPPGGAG